MEKIKNLIYKLLKWSEKIFKTDMLYVARSGFWLNLNSIIGSALSLILTILFAHYLSKEVFGIYKYILSMAGIAVAFSLNGINTAVTRAVAQGYDGIFKKSIVIQMKWVIPQAIFTLILSIYYFYYGNTVYGISFLIVSLLGPISSIANTYTALLNGKKDFETFSIYGIISNLIYFTLSFLTVVLLPNVVYLVLAYFIATAGSNVFFCFKAYNKYKLNDNFRKEDVTYGKHISLLNIIGMVAAQLDNVIVYHLLGPAALAIFSFATIIPEKIRTLFGFISTAALPKLSENDNLGISTNIGKKIEHLIMMAIIISSVYIVMAPYIFEWFFPQYLSSVIYSQVFSLSLIAIAANIPVTKLYADKLQKELYIVGTTGPIAKVIILLFVVNIFGIWGAIFAKMFSHILSMILSIFLVRRKQ